VKVVVDSRELDSSAAIDWSDSLLDSMLEALRWRAKGKGPSSSGKKMSAWHEHCVLY
jgi:hypothetical protein